MAQRILLDFLLDARRDGTVAEGWRDLTRKLRPMIIGSDSG